LEVSKIRLIFAFIIIIYYFLGKYDINMLSMMLNRIIMAMDDIMKIKSLVEK